jgi:ubiquinone/menaquinone biosynthesis C-methylase UbiE
MNEESVKQFYSKIKFPGIYSIDDLDYYNRYPNEFLRPYVSATVRATNILEIGCGTGYITNLVAKQNAHAHIDAVDFSDSIDVAKSFSQNHNIRNITYYKENFLDFNINKKYDLVISNGVIHHIVEYQKAIDKIKDINADEMVLGVYNTYGKLAKKIIKVSYINDLLRTDQEDCPFETSFTKQQFCNYFPNYTLEHLHPGGNIRNLFNYKNGGLSIYHFVREFG